MDSFMPVPDQLKWTLNFIVFGSRCNLSVAHRWQLTSSRLETQGRAPLQVPRSLCVDAQEKVDDRDLRLERSPQLRISAITVTVNPHDLYAAGGKKVKSR